MGDGLTLGALLGNMGPQNSLGQQQAYQHGLANQYGYVTVGTNVATSGTITISPSITLWPEQQNDARGRAKKPEGALEWLDRRVAEMRVAL